MILRLLLLIGLSISIGCAKNDEPAKNKSSSTVTQSGENDLKPGVYNKSFVAKSGDVVRYTILIPEGYQPDQPTPLIVGLHYGGEVTPHYAHGFMMALLAPGLGELNAIIVAPDSIAGRWNNDRNENVVLELMDTVNEQYNIDQDKTLLTGFSMGGRGTWYIGSRNQDRFSAMIPIAGSPIVEEDVEWTTPIYVIHSRADEIVPIKATEEYVEGQKEKGYDQIVFSAVDDLPHFETSSFSFPLQDAVPWVRKIWDGNQDEQ